MEILAIYKGEFGMFRDILVEGTQYQCEILEDVITVIRLKGENNEPLDFVHNSYGKLEDFIKDWDNVEVLRNGEQG